VPVTSEDESLSADGNRTETTTEDVSVGSVDTTGDVAYWSGFALYGVIEWERYESLAQMTNTATVVILARALGDGPIWTGHGDPDVAEDVIIVRSIRVEVLGVLAGELRPEDGSEIIVTGLAVPRGRPPSAPAVLFLRHHHDDRVQPPPPVIDDPADRAAYQAQKADYDAFAADTYRLVSSQGIFIETHDGVVNPARPSGGAISDEVSGRSFDELAADIASVAGRPELGATVEDFICCEPAE
jgi:hypothetical protein